MKVLVTGAGGLLGGRLATLLSVGSEIFAGRHESPVPPGLPAVPLDLLAEGSIERAFDRCQPDAVLHAAALADPDLCERAPDRALAVNSEATRRIARRCRESGIRLVALSTDLVFSGAGAPWGEAAATQPLLVYGRTKREGERVLLEACPDGAVARVALVHGRGFGRRATASESVAWALAEGRPVRLYTDQLRTPVDAESLAAALARLLTGSGAGLYHLGGAERVSRYDLGVRTARALGLDASRIEPIRFADHAGAAPRPADVSLDSSRAMRELGWTPRPLDAALRESRPAREGPS